ncbi:MAG: hypothetical protein MUC79_07845 [Thiobacillaceae bacterium]|jgi:ABC-type phosphate transport system substrate-binding protein|nr:hypothetical protein [Thiobacillaceae bacterium]
MRRLPVLRLIALLTGMLAVPAHAELVVVVHPDNPVGELRREQVVDLYTGRGTKFPAGNAVILIDHAADSELRAAFYRGLVGKTVAQINAYWARLLFSGRASPPIVLPSVAAVLDAVRKNRDAIAYLDSRDLDGRVKVVFRLK